MSQLNIQAGRWLNPDNGTVLSHPDLMAGMAKKQAVLLGETHDRYDIHRWQLHMLAGLHARRTDIVVGFEMFPRSVQPALDAWVAGTTDAETFLAESRWNEVWRFDPALYMPIFHFCRQFRLPMLGLNCRRPLVTEVGKLGWDAIPKDDRDGLTPSAPATPGHRRYLFEITGGGRPDRKATSPDDPEFDRFVRAQQTWDRSFACRIADAHRDFNGALVVGIIGRGHLEYRHGTPYQLEDLGLRDTGVLLPQDHTETQLQPGVADAVFILHDDGKRASRDIAGTQPA